MNHIIAIDDNGIIIEHDGVTECADCGKPIDSTSGECGDEWDGSCPHCGASKDRVGLRLDYQIDRCECSKCGKEGYLADNTDGEILIDGRLYRLSDDLDLGAVLVANTCGNGNAICDDCAQPQPIDSLESLRDAMIASEPRVMDGERAVANGYIETAVVANVFPDPADYLPRLRQIVAVSDGLLSLRREWSDDGVYWRLEHTWISSRERVRLMRRDTTQARRLYEEIEAALVAGRNAE